MAESTLGVDPGTTLKLHTYTRTIGANSVLDEFVLMGENPYATYVAAGNGISIGTANSHTIQLMAGSSQNVRIRSIHIKQSALAGTEAIGAWQLLRLSSAGSGGSGITPAPYDTSDSAAGATCQSLPSSKGTETTNLHNPRVTIANATSTVGLKRDEWEWHQQPGMKPIIVPAGTSNGIALKNITAIASASVVVEIIFQETSFL